MADLLSIREQARKHLHGACQVCTFCDGRACAGQIPGIGGIGRGKAFIRNVETLAQYQLVLRTLHGVTEPQLKTQLWGLQLETPILAAPIAGSAMNLGGYLTEEELASAMVRGAQSAGSVAFTGDGPISEFYSQGLNAVRDSQGWGIPVTKPWPNTKILHQIEMAAETGASAVAIDVDAAAFVNMMKLGATAGPKTQKDLIEIVDKAALPVILKGIMAADEAKLAIDAGISGIIVSNHGGRVLEHVQAPAEVLWAIAPIVKGKIPLLADGGVRNGSDVLKLLALGCDAVLVGRPLAIGAVGGKWEGVKLTLEAMTKELHTAMILTGCPDVGAVSSHILACSHK